MLWKLLGCLSLTSAEAQDEAEPVGSVTYDLDWTASKLYAEVFRDPAAVGSEVSHDHVILATNWKGAVELSEDLSICNWGADVPVNGLSADLPELRRLVGHEIMLTPAQREQVSEHMRSATQLDESTFPDIRFRSRSCEGSLDALEVTGRLEIHGVDKDVVLPLAVTVEGDVLTARGSLSVSHSDFGLQPYEAFFGALKNREDIKLTLDVVGTAR